MTPDGPSSAIWLGIGLVVVTAVLTVVGMVVLESRRRVRREARRIEDAILSRTFADPALRGVRVSIAPRASLWGGGMHLDVHGWVISAAQRDAVLALAREQAARTSKRVQVNDSLRVASTPPRHGEVA